jgi:hypothetical protein
MEPPLAAGDQVLVVPRSGGGAVYHGAAGVSPSSQLLELTVADLPELQRGERAVLVRLQGESRLKAEAAFIGRSSPTSSRFQLLGAWHVIERRIFPRFETNLRADVRNLQDGLTQEGKVLDMSEGGMRVRTRRPAAGPLEVLVHEGTDGMRLTCDVVGSNVTGQTTELRLRFQNLAPEQRRFIHRMVTTLQALDEHGRNLLAS